MMHVYVKAEALMGLPLRRPSPPSLLVSSARLVFPLSQSPFTAMPSEREKMQPRAALCLCRCHLGFGSAVPI